MNLRSPLSAAICGVLAVACAAPTGSPDTDGGGPAMPTIGGSGGTLAVAGARLTIPGGALNAALPITMSVTLDPTPAGYTAFSPLFRFEPAGTTFAKPVTVSIPFKPPASGTIAIFWSRSDGKAGYEQHAATVAGSVATVDDVTHFSEGFVGLIDTGPCLAPKKMCAGLCVDASEADANCGEWAQWPVPLVSPTQDTYTSTSDTVFDKVTGLTWQRTASDKKYLWQEAVDYCSGLDLAGSQTWRMPTRIELLSIVDLTTVPAINADAFPLTQVGEYWSRTVSPRGTAKRYFVDFGDGRCDNSAGDLNTTRYQVRCVR